MYVSGQSILDVSLYLKVGFYHQCRLCSDWFRPTPGLSKNGPRGGANWHRSIILTMPLIMHKLTEYSIMAQQFSIVLKSWLWWCCLNKYLWPALAVHHFYACDHCPAFSTFPLSSLDVPEFGDKSAQFLCLLPLKRPFHWQYTSSSPYR